MSNMLQPWTGDFWLKYKLHGGRGGRRVCRLHWLAGDLNLSQSLALILYFDYSQQHKSQTNQNTKMGWKQQMSNSGSVIIMCVSPSVNIKMSEHEDTKNVFILDKSRRTVISQQRPIEWEMSLKTCEVVCVSNEKTDIKLRNTSWGHFHVLNMSPHVTVLMANGWWSRHIPNK